MQMAKIATDAATVPKVAATRPARIGPSVGPVISASIDVSMLMIASSERKISRHDGAYGSAHVQVQRFAGLSSRFYRPSVYATMCSLPEAITPSSSP